MIPVDIHTHKDAPQPDAVISLSLPEQLGLLPWTQDEATGFVQLYSVGIHPWDAAKFNAEVASTLEKAAGLPYVVAIGECGIDLVHKEVPLFRQMEVFKFQIEMSERVKKPLIIHDVKAHDIIIGLRRDMKPSQPWIIHGFRGKPSVAQMLLKAGCLLSFGEKFNPDTVRLIEPDKILTETDCSPLSIHDIRKLIDQARQ